MTHTILKSAIAPPPVTYEDAVEAFGRLVSIYIAELQAWHDHDAIVKTQGPLRDQPKWRDHARHKGQAALYLKDNAAWKAERLARHDPYPKPIGHSDIIASVATKVAEDGANAFVADFEVMNDDPTPEDILTAKKSSLLEQVLGAEDAAKAAVLLPVGKRRAADVRENDIRVSDAEIASAFLKKRSEDQKAAIAAVNATHAAAVTKWTAEVAATRAIDPKADLPSPPSPPAPPAPEDVGSLVAEHIESSRSPEDTKHLREQESRRGKINDIMHAAAQAMSDIEDLTVDNVDAYQIPNFDVEVRIR
jgi:hypothetical protein